MPQLVLTEDEVQQMQALASSRSLPHLIVQRAQVVLNSGCRPSQSSPITRSITAARKPDGYKRSTDP